MDLRSGDIITLTNGVTLYAEGIDIVLRSHEDPTILVRPIAEGENFSTALGEYQIEAINLDERTITVKKIQIDDEAGYRVETLLLEKSSESIETITNTSSAPSNITKIFEIYFQ